MAKRGRKPKDPFSELTAEERDALAAMTDDEIRNRIAKAALDQEALESAMADDGDLKERKLAYDYAKEPYKTGKKRLKQFVKFGRQTLDSRGKESGTSPVER